MMVQQLMQQQAQRAPSPAMAPAPAPTPTNAAALAQLIQLQQQSGAPINPGLLQMLAGLQAQRAQQQGGRGPMGGPGYNMPPQ
jgi:hypothetical protein